MYVFAFIVAITKEDLLKIGLSKGVNNILEYADKCLVDKRKFLIKELGCQVEELFPDSLDKPKCMASGDEQNTISKYLGCFILIRI